MGATNAVASDQDKPEKRRRHGLIGSWIAGLLCLLLVLAAPAMAADSTVERVSLFAARTTVAGEDRREPSVAGSLASAGLAVVDFTESTPQPGSTEWKWQLKNTSGATINDLRLTGFINVDFAAPDNTFFNETGLNASLTAPAGRVAADRWEIGEPGYWTGGLLYRAAIGDLSNTADVALPGEDVAMALSAAPGGLAPNQEVTVWLVFDQDASSGLQQKSNANGDTKNLHFYLQKAAVPASTHSVDYAVTQTATNASVALGDTVEYQIVLTNQGPTDGTGATLTSTVPAQITHVQWTCSAQGTAVCLSASGSGNDLSVQGQIPSAAGSQLLITVRGTAAVDATVDHLVSVAPTHADTVDTNPLNNTSTARVVIGTGSTTAKADLAIQKTTSTPRVAAQEQAVFQITVTNHGPSDVSQARLRDVVPAALDNVRWSCSAAGGAQCPASTGQGSDIDLALDMPVGSTVQVQVLGTLTQTRADVVNIASISSNLSDPVPSNNTSAATLNKTAGVLAPIPAVGTAVALLLSVVAALLGWAYLARRGAKTALWRALLPGALVAVFLLLPGQSHAVFVNGDFESQSLNGWVKRFGTNPGLGGNPPFQASDVQMDEGGVEKVTIVDGHFDPRAPQLTLPRQGNFSAKVNDEDNSYHINEISQQAVIAETDRDPGDGKLHVRFSYAAVLEDPNHGPNSQPYFFVELKDLTRGETLYYDFAFANQPGRLFYTTIYNGSKWTSTPFIDVDMVVPDTSLGNALQIRVVGADCAAGAHGGYVYVDAFGSVSIPPQGACIHDLKVRAKPGNAQLTWADTGAAAYAVYRAEQIDGPYVHLGNTQSRLSTWLDRTVEPQKTYYYSVRSLDVAGHEVCSSGEIATVVLGHWSIGDPVKRPPIFTSTPVLTGDIRAPYEYQATAVDADGDTLAYQLMYAPVGMAVNAASGKINWQPSLAGDYRVNLQVSDGKGLLASQAFSIHVVDGNLPPKITNLFPSKVPAGVAFTHQVQAHDPENGPLQYTIGSQASGLTISAWGEITWDDPQPGTYPLTIQVTDEHGARDVQQVVVSVEGFPEFSSLPIITATTGQAYSYAALATDRDGDTVTYSVLEGPAGLVINASTGVVSWLAPVTGDAQVTLGASDPSGNVGKQTYTLRVTTTANRAPFFTATPVTFVAYPSTYFYTATAQDDDGDILTWSLLQAPAGMSINAHTGLVTWAFGSAVAGKFAVQVQVDDRRGGLSTQSFEVQVPVHGNGAPVIQSSPPTQVVAGQLFSYYVSATDPENEPLTYSLKQGPASAVWTGNQLDWQTSAADVGLHPLVIAVADPSGNTTEQSWQLQVTPASTNQPPVITSMPRVTATAGAVYEYQVDAVDYDGDPLQYQLVTAPAGMTISASGNIEWAVPATFAGSQAVEIKVTDGRGGEASQAYAIGVGFVTNQPPQIQSTPITVATAGDTYQYQVIAYDPDGDTLAYSLSTSEPGITIDASTGLVEWDVPAGAVGQAHVAVLVTDGKGGSASQTYAIGLEQTGNSAPYITSQPVVAATAGTSYAYAVSAYDPDGDTLSYSLLEYPQGMLIDSATGAIEWAIPANVAGLAPVTIEVSDGRGGLATQGYAISVTGSSSSAPLFMSQPTTLATAGIDYAYTAWATDANGYAVTYALTSAPAGMAINAQSGEVSWTPQAHQIGINPVAIQATNTQGASATQSFSIYVQLAANNPPQITSSPVIRGEPGVPYQYQVSASDPDGDALSYSLPTAPAGMVISGMGLVNWANPAAGIHTVEVKVEDTHGAYAVQRYSLHIGANNAPVITSSPVPLATVGESYSYQVQAFDPDGDFLTYQITGFPMPLTISASGLITGTPTDPGAYNVSVMVSDGQITTTQSWTLSVRQPAAAGPLQASITASPKYLNLGESTTLQIFVEGGAQPYTVNYLTINGSTVAVDQNMQATFTPTDLGKHTMQLMVYDAAGTSAEAQDWFSVIDPSDTEAPLAIITAPGSSSDISVTDVFAPTAIMGTASDAHLAEYELLISEAGKNQWSRIGAGTTSVTDGKLGELEPQTLVNGLYDIGLIVRDTAGHESTAKITVAISGEQKTAPLQLTFTDMSFEIEGMPLTVRRSYDSLKRHQRMDFGYGWTVDYQDVWLQTNGVLGRSWVMTEAGSGLSRKLCVQPQGSRVASVRLPGGGLEQFEMRAEPECTLILQWTGEINIAFTPKANNKSGSKLEALGVGALRIAGGNLFDMDSTDTLNPSQYKLTLLDGTEYILNKDFGVQQIKDRRGNTLQFTDSGISHSGGFTLAFTRDAQGKITRITGPGNQQVSYSYDSAENLSTAVDQAGATSEFRYDNPRLAHALTSYTDPLGRLALKTTYDDAGRVLSQTDATGQAVSIDTDNNARKQTIKDRNGNTTVYEFDDRGNITKTVDAAGGVTQYAYDANDNEIEVIDPLGRKTTRTYDAHGHITSETDPAGRTSATSYNAEGNVLAMTDAAGRVTTNAYNAMGELTSITDPAGEALTLGYIPTGSLASLEDKTGRTTSYSYAKINGAMLKQTETAPDGTVTTYSYDAAGHLASSTRAIVTAPGQSATTVVESSTYDAAGRLASRTDAAGSTSTYQYDAAGQLSQETDSQGRKTTHEYNLRGEKTQTTYPDGRTQTWAYDNNGNEVQSCEAGLCSKTSYDTLDRATQVTDPLGYVTQTIYDAAGQVTASVDALGHSTTYAYDAAGRQTSQTNAAGHTSTREYDAAGNLIKVTDALGRATVYTYSDTYKRTSTTDPTGALTRYSYDANGALLGQTNPLGQHWQYAYDPLGALKTVTDPLGKTTSYGWNGQNQLLAQTDANGHTTGYGYDAAGRRVARSLPGGTNEALVYDSEGRLISKTDFDGSQSTYSYDAGGKPSKTTRADGTTLATGYDHYGRATSYTDSAHGILTLTLDANGRTTQESWYHASLGTELVASIDYAWDGNGQRTQISTTGSTGSAQTIAASYNALGQLETLTHPSGSQTRFTYDAAGRRTQTTRADGSTSDYQYNAAGQLTALSHQKADGTAIARFAYSLNAAGQRTQVQERLVDVGAAGAAQTIERTVHYQYDAAGKLLQEKIEQTAPTAFASTIDYQYDPAGNRSQRSISHNGQSTTYQYDSDDRLTQSVDSLNGTTTYQWDGRGNLIGKTTGASTTSYTWTADNRLAKVTQGTKTTEYGYDATGRRIKRLVKDGASTTETHYWVDHQRAYSEIAIESTKVNGGAWVDSVYVHTPDGVGELIESSAGAAGSTQYYTDGLGSVRVAQTPANTHSFSYDAFGIELSDAEGIPANAAEANQVTHRYTGEYADQHTGLLYLRARDYDPQVGRFISMDEHPGKQSIPLTLNKYLYGNADPVNTIDPSGNFGLGGMMSGIGSMSNMAAMSYARMAVFDMLSNALLSPIIDSAVKSFMSDGNSPRVVYGNAGVAQLLTSFALTCRVTNKCLLKKIPVIVNGWASPETSRHIWDALQGNGGTVDDVPYPLSFILIKNSRRADVNSNIRNRSVRCGNRPPGYDCDEYPYASTFNGGNLMYQLGGVSLRAVPSKDNRMHGSKLGSFYRKNRLTSGKPFINLAIPYGPGFYIDKNGKASML